MKLHLFLWLTNDFEMWADPHSPPKSFSQQYGLIFKQVQLGRKDTDTQVCVYVRVRARFGVCVGLFACIAIMSVNFSKQK